VAATRRLAAVMFTDMVGYTASTQTDEKGTLELLHDQEELVRPLFAAYQGREIKSTGDGFLVEFDSALKAIQCAVDIQSRIHERNAQASATPFQIRIGIHLGDVEQRGTDILGDAVNIAARIQPIAEPGGVCVSGAIFEQVWNKIPAKLEKLPPRTLKGLQVPMDVYRVALPGMTPEPSPSSFGLVRLAVLPFTNISPDPNDEYFADGLTEEMITVLSQLPGLRVIARTSVNLYRSTPKSVAQIGAELGVDAILQGSVRKAGDQLRIAVQLIDVGTQEHTWASTYDRKLDKMFSVQSEIAKRVAKQLKVSMREAEGVRLGTRPPVQSDSYLAYLKGRSLLHRADRVSVEAAKGEFVRAISLDRRNAAAHSGLADVTRLLGGWYADSPRAKWDEDTRRLVTRAIELDPNLAEAHASRALILLDDYDYVAAEKELQLSLSLNPSNSWAHLCYAALLVDQARAEEALRQYELAEGSDPFSRLTLGSLAMFLVWLGRFDEALLKIQKLGELSSYGSQYHSILARYYLDRSDLEACREEIGRYLELEADERSKSLMKAHLHALSREKEQARTLLRQEEALPRDPTKEAAVAYVFAELGDLDECFRFLERSVANHDIGLQPWRLDPRLENVRRDPRFQPLLKRMNLA